MKYVDRHIEPSVLSAARGFPCVILTGPRRAGKTWLLKHLFPTAQYYLLEDPDIIARIKGDPHGFLDEIRTPVVLDEIQNVPELFAYIRTRIDAHPRRMGQWLLTGSQEAPLMQGVSESMAGRAAVLPLLPLSYLETEKVSILRGGYPEVISRPANASLWFSSYIQTYLERDVRAITQVKDLSLFRRFMALIASRHGQLLNKTDLAAPLGVSVPTISQWLSVLEATAQVFLIPPYFENFGKRLVKSPRLYLADSGVAAHLLGIETQAELKKSPFAGALFEGFVAGEIIKKQLNAGKRRELYYFRDEQGLEVDFVIPEPGRRLHLVECKSTRTPTPAMASALQRLGEAIRSKGGSKVTMTLVHEAPKSGVVSRVLAKGVDAKEWQKYLSE